MLLVLMASAMALDPVDLVLQGVCDGSAAVRVGNANLLVAYDEDRSLHLYGPRGGPRLASRDLGPALNITDPTELDIEGAAATLTEIWWMGSHGNNKNGKQRPNRQVLFATNTPQRADLSDLRLVRPSTDLLPVLRAVLPTAFTDEVRALAPKKGGLNLEGLAYHPDGLLVGLRSPLSGPGGTEGSARIVLLDTKGPIRATRVFEVDLQNRGVRSLEWTGKDWLIVAGPVDPHDDPQLFRWRGDASKPVAIDAPLAGLNPEGLVQVEPGRWAVFSDDGAIERADWNGGKDGQSECKDIRATNPQGPAHPSVHSRGRLFDLK